MPHISRVPHRARGLSFHSEPASEDHDEGEQPRMYMQQDGIGNRNAIAFFEQWVADGMPTLQASAEKHGITDERVRQKLYKGSRVLSHPSSKGHRLHGLASEYQRVQGQGGRIRDRLTSSPNPLR